MSKYSNQVRIISGQWRSRMLSFPDSEGLRPTSDRIRETLFNWLQLDIAGASCLDLFCGSGALAFEALSRGASRVVAIEKDANVAEQLKKNAALLECKNLELYCEDALNWIVRHKQKGQFDIIFLDPPFSDQLLQKTCNLIIENELLKNNGLIYIESDQTLENLSLHGSLEFLKQKKAGQVFYALLGNNS